MTLNEITAADQIGFPILSLMILTPVAAGLIIWGLKEERAIRMAALAATLIDLVLAVALFLSFKRGVADLQFVERRAWIPMLGISYHLGIDGISIALVALSALLSLLAILFSWDTVHDHLREYMLCLLGLQATLIGVFSAIDVVLFFLFWEVMLLPMFFLIRTWGGANREYAAIKFVLYTLLGSMLMLVGFVILFVNYREAAALHGFAAPLSFDLTDLLKAPLPHRRQILIFSLLFFGFAFKIPMVPFHTWLPDAHVEAPTAGSVMLAGVLLKMGAYGFLRFSLPLLPEASHAFVPLMFVLSVIAIVYGAVLALAQTDIKKLIAYSSISHLGYVTLGLFSLNAQGIQGGLLQMVNHGISTAGLFFIVGILYERRHTRDIAQYGGLAKVVPLLATFYLLITLASLGLPGTNGFIGEFLILVGAFEARWEYAVLATAGLILGAAYLLWLYQRVMYGPVTNPLNLTLRDLSPREIVICSSLVLLIFWIGFYPRPLLTLMEPSIHGILSRVGPETMIVRLTEHSPARPVKSTSRSLFTVGAPERPPRADRERLRRGRPEGDPADREFSTPAILKTAAE